MPTDEEFEQQVDDWVAGNPRHLGDKSNPGSTCCPDSSCCLPELLAPPEVRAAFKAAHGGDRHKFLMGFLGAAIASCAPGKNVEIVDCEGGEPDG